MKGYFYTSPFKGYNRAIDKGKCILTALSTNDKSILHAIVVVGQRTDNTLIFVDPINGKLMVDVDHQINSKTNISISAAK